MFFPFATDLIHCTDDISVIWESEVALASSLKEHQDGKIDRNELLLFCADILTSLALEEKQKTEVIKYIDKFLEVNWSKIENICKNTDSVFEVDQFSVQKAIFAKFVEVNPAFKNYLQSKRKKQGLV